MPSELQHKTQRLDALATALENPPQLAAQLANTHGSGAKWLKTLNDPDAAHSEAWRPG